MKIDTQVLIIGAGPSGATLSLLLAKQYGIKSVVVSRHKGTANTPRAHIFNQRAMEVMRDLDLEETLSQLAVPSSAMAHTSWSYSLAGREYGRLWSWGNHPSRLGEYRSASPCEMTDLPQSYLEPVLVEKGREYGVEYRFNHEFLTFKQDEEHVETIVRDRNDATETIIRSLFLIGADGARSQVLETLDIPILGRQLNTAFNVHIRADLSKYFRHRPGSLNWILNPSAPDWSAVGNFRMVRPWNEFVVSMHPGNRNGEPFEPTEGDLRERLCQMIGEKDIPIEILSAYRWTINDQVAESWQKNRVMCIGDATHRHPPINGLGSNTCISDAFNLAWKLACVLKGWAGRGILDSLTQERKPVGEAIVRRANAGMEVHRELWSIIGLTADERETALKTMEQADQKGEALRERYLTVLEKVDDEVQAIGIQMNQFYLDSVAIIAELKDSQPRLEQYNLLKQVVVSTHPGFHLPHVWLAKDGQSPRVSTLDLAGHGAFTMFTGIGGAEWKAAARICSSEFGLPIHAYTIGIGCDFMDAYRDWRKVRGVTEDGIVLVRPDHFIAWRSNGVASGHELMLEKALRQCLVMDR